MADALVEVDAVSRDFRRGTGSIRVVRSASCRVMPGQRIALVGPSGSGKSTLLHLMAGLDRPSAGTVAWPGLGPAETLRPARLALVTQLPSLVPSLSAVENVELPLLLGGRTAAATEAMAALRLFGLAGLSEKLPEELSGGQAQRVAMARAVAANPRLILADEPTGQLDHATASQMLDALFGYLDERGAALVIATHDASIAARVPVVWQMRYGTLEVPLPAESAA
jgi:putative ABC transport system ATP-binding protein/lipoprotein-releasing system ATP-binding protein